MMSRCGNSAYCWKTVLTSRLCAGIPTTGSPPIWISPSVGCSNPAIMRKVVVLPHPDGPSRARNSPSRMSRSSRSTAATSSNRLVTPRRDTTGCVCSMRRMYGRHSAVTSAVVSLRDGPRVTQCHVVRPGVGATSDRVSGAVGRLAPGSPPGDARREPGLERRAARPRLLLVGAAVQAVDGVDPDVAQRLGLPGAREGADPGELRQRRVVVQDEVLEGAAGEVGGRDALADVAAGVRDPGRPVEAD